jgi:hypothetical protein
MSATSVIPPGSELFSDQWGDLSQAGVLASSSASQASGLASEGMRQSPRGDSAPPEEIFGPLGTAERLNWLAKKRVRNRRSHRLISARS